MQLVTSANQIEEISFSDLLQQSPQTLLFFYSKDNTPGCSKEAQEFSLHQERFSQRGIQIIGVSKDSPRSHCHFIDKQGLQLRLIADEDLTLHQQFGARGEKKNYGKIYQGAIRSTFLLDQQGTILRARQNVKATGHVERVMRELETSAAAR